MQSGSHTHSLILKSSLISQKVFLEALESTELFAQSLVKSLHGMIFLGTPHVGSSLGAWGDILGRLTRISIRDSNAFYLLSRSNALGTLSMIQQEFFDNLRRRELEGYPPVNIATLFEELPIPTIGLVSYLPAIYPPTLKFETDRATIDGSTPRL